MPFPVVRAKIYIQVLLGGGLKASELVIDKSLTCTIPI